MKGFAGRDWFSIVLRVFENKQKAAQPEFWVATEQLPKSPKSTFYAKLDETLESFGFAGKVRQICAPAYKQTGTGRPGIDPVVYLKMITVGFFGCRSGPFSITNRMRKPRIIPVSRSFASGWAWIFTSWRSALKSRRKVGAVMTSMGKGLRERPAATAMPSKRWRTTARESLAGKSKTGPRRRTGNGPKSGALVPRAKL